MRSNKSHLPTSSLIIATYNDPVALNLVLKSVARQSHLPDEVIIADDGSTDATKDIISSYRDSIGTTLQHVYQLDKGFRLARIRNKAMLHARFSYIIQIDGDVILHRHFVRDHLQMAEPNVFFVGSRAQLDPSLTARTRSSGQINFSILTKGLKNHFNAIYMPLLSVFFKSPSNDPSYIVNRSKGCNMGFWRTDVVRVNGYNEIFEGWGMEDSELGIRFANSGITQCRIKLRAIQYHLYHKEYSRERLEKNKKLLQIELNKNVTWCEKGMSIHVE